MSETFFDTLGAGKCFFYLLVVAFLFVLFVFARKRFEQVVLILGLSIVIGFLVRLFSFRPSDQSELIAEAFFLLAIGAVYGLVWLGSRHFRVGARGGPRKKS